MSEAERGGSLRYATTSVVVIVVLALVGCGALMLLPRQNDPVPMRLMTTKDLAAAYARVQPGLTRTSQLARLGLDPGSASAQALSYLGVIERFMPRDSVRFDGLNAALQDCIEARDHCTALVFRPVGRVHLPAHNEFLSALGLGASAAGAEVVPEVTLLVRDGRVAFKMITGMPMAREQRSFDEASAPHSGATFTRVSYRSVY